MPDLETYSQVDWRRISDQAGNDKNRTDFPNDQLTTDLHAFTWRTTANGPFYHVYGPKDGNALRMLIDPLSYLGTTYDEVVIANQFAALYQRPDTDNTIDVSAKPGELFVAIAALPPIIHPLNKEPIIPTIFHGKLDLKTIREMSTGK